MFVDVKKLNCLLLKTNSNLQTNTFPKSNKTHQVRSAWNRLHLKRGVDYKMLLFTFQKQCVLSAFCGELRSRHRSPPLPCKSLIYRHTNLQTSSQVQSSAWGKWPTPAFATQNLISRTSVQMGKEDEQSCPLIATQVPNNRCPHLNPQVCLYMHV